MGKRSGTGVGERCSAVARRPVVVLRSELLGQHSWLRHGFSTRQGGVSISYSSDGTGELNCAETPGDTTENVRENRELFVAEVWTASHKPEFLTLKQIHSGLVWRDPPPRTSGDALLTERKGVLLGIRVADCVPILLADVKKQAIAAVHAGWRGTVERIVEKAVGEMRAQLGSDPADIVAAIGPSIRVCCYEVGDEVVAAFHSCFAYADNLFRQAPDDPVRSRYPMLFMTGSPPGHAYDPRWNRESPAMLDIAEANRRQLLDAGVRTERIDVMPYCTSCRADLFFSHRRDAGRTGRMLAAIGMPNQRVT